jgi:hypothetical protein
MSVFDQRGQKVTGFIFNSEGPVHIQGDVVLGNKVVSSTNTPTLTWANLVDLTSNGSSKDHSKFTSALIWLTENPTELSGLIAAMLNATILGELSAVSPAFDRFKVTLSKQIEKHKVSAHSKILIGYEYVFIENHLNTTFFNNKVAVLLATRLLNLAVILQRENIKE